MKGILSRHRIQAIFFHQALCKCLFLFGFLFFEGFEQEVKKQSCLRHLFPFLLLFYGSQAQSFKPLILQIYLLQSIKYDKPVHLVIPRLHFLISGSLAVQYPYADTFLHHFPAIWSQLFVYFDEKRHFFLPEITIDFYLWHDLETRSDHFQKKFIEFFRRTFFIFDKLLIYLVQVLVNLISIHLNVGNIQILINDMIEVIIPFNQIHYLYGWLIIITQKQYPSSSFLTFPYIYFHLLILKFNFLVHFYRLNTFKSGLQKCQISIFAGKWCKINMGQLFYVLGCFY